MMLFIEYVVRGIFLGAMYGLLALPMSLAFVTVGTIDFAVGAYALLAAAIGATVGGTLGVVLGLGGALGASIVMAGIFVLLKRVGHHDTLMVALSSFGLAVAIGSIVLATWGSTAFVRQGLDAVWTLAGIRINPQGPINLSIGIALVTALMGLLYGTGFGRVLRASAVNPVGAELAGIPVLTVQAIIFVAGGLIGGICGVLILYSSGLDFTAGLSLTLSGFAAAIVFGVKNPVQGFAGGVAIGVAEALSAGYGSGAMTALVPQFVVLLVLGLGLMGSGRFTGYRP